jgi:hypothetical protein
VLAILMGICLAASLIDIPKFITLKSWSPTMDLTWDTTTFIMWTILEVYVVIISISISVPSLKSYFESGLRKLGLLSTKAASGSDLDGALASRTAGRKPSLYPGTSNHGSNALTVDTDITMMNDQSISEKLSPMDLDFPSSPSTTIRFADECRGPRDEVV